MGRLRRIAGSWEWDEIFLGLFGALIMRLSMEVPHNMPLLTASWLLGMGCAVAAWWLRRRRLAEEAMSGEQE
jgi:hypothetical protein